MINVEQTIISQYSSSSTIVSMIEGVNICIDPRADLDNFFNYVFNVETARGFGLDICGRIVNVGREIEINIDDYFGFDGTNYTPFNDQPFYNGEPVTGIYRLADEAYRRLILTKALANITSLTANGLNYLLSKLFAGRGNCYVLDFNNMTMRYVFEFPLESYEKAILSQAMTVPRPAGVLCSLLIAPTPSFGFSEASDAYPFDDGCFIPESSYYEII